MLLADEYMHIWLPRIRGRRDLSTNTEGSAIKMPLLRRLRQGKHELANLRQCRWHAWRQRQRSIGCMLLLAHQARFGIGNQPCGELHRLTERHQMSARHLVNR